MSKVNDGGPAFPSGEKLSVDAQGRRDDRLSIPLHSGMSLRDYFASCCIRGVLMPEDVHNGEWDDPEIGKRMAQVATAAYEFADAMLAARSKGGAS